MKRIILTILAIVSLLILIGSIWGYFAFLSTKPLTKEELAELTPDWSVITHNNWSPWFVDPDATGSPKTTWNPAASFNAWLDTVPEQDKAWPILVEEYYAHLELFDHEDMGVYPDDVDDWDKLVEMLDTQEHAQLVERLIDALNLPVFGVGLYATTIPYEHQIMMQHAIDDDGWNPSMLSINAELMSVNLSTLGNQRRVTDLLVSYAMIKVQQGDIDEAIDIIETVMDSTCHALEYSSLLGHLVEVVILDKARDFVLRSIHNQQDEFTDEHLRRIEDLFKEHHAVTIVWESEVLVYHDLIRRMATSSGGINYPQLKQFYEHLGTDGTSMQPVHLPDAELKESLQRPLYLYNKSFSLLDNQSQIPWEEDVTGGYDYLQSEYDSISIIFKLLTDILMPSTEQVAGFIREYNQRSHSSRLLIAFYRHHLRHSVFPPSIEIIDDDLLTFKPIDAFTGDLLKYRLTPEGPIIYSVGTDRDDDNATPMLDYDISELGSDKNISSYWKSLIPGFAEKPHWVSQSRVDTINESWPEKIDGDWVLYPTPINPDED